jgi:hypothetical protein
VKFAGLLDLAHQRGLQALKVDWTSNDAELSLAHAVAVFPFGTFEESGDASPSNVNKGMAKHTEEAEKKSRTGRMGSMEYRRYYFCVLLVGLW